MKRILTLFMLLCFCYGASISQTKPAANNLIHLWDFEDDTPMDQIGNAHGTLNELASIHDGYLDLSDANQSGGYLALPADIINIKNYNEISIEIWCKPYTSFNSPNPNMLWSFGDEGNPGKNYFFFTPGRWGTGVAARISVGDEAPWANEDGLNFSANIGDSALHHYVVTIDKDRIMKLFVDGVLLEYGDEKTKAIDTLSSTHTLNNVSNEAAFVGKAVYPDPTWKGIVELFAIWNVALSEDNISWLFDKGAKRDMIESSIKSSNKNNRYTIMYNNTQLFISELNTSFDQVKLFIYNPMGVQVYASNNFKNGESIILNKGIYIAKLKINKSYYLSKFIVK